MLHTCYVVFDFLSSPKKLRFLGSFHGKAFLEHEFSSSYNISPKLTKKIVLLVHNRGANHINRDLFPPFFKERPPYQV